MALNLYRRHRKECEAGRAEDSNSGEFAERTRGWKRCACVIFVSGTLAGRFSRKRTGATTWDEARAYAAAVEALATAWPEVRRRCEEAERFSRDLGAALP